MHFFKGSHHFYGEEYFALTTYMLHVICCRFRLYLAPYQNSQPIVITCTPQFFCCLYKILSLKINQYTFRDGYGYGVDWSQRTVATK